jgi:hypothetical protein
MRVPAQSSGLPAGLIALLQARTKAVRSVADEGDPATANPSGRRLNPHAVERPVAPERGAPPRRGSIIDILV